ncbi:MAG: DUF2029 domain-containing protein [bacterium]|nr:DUF2029 domain-containing protein [bacterium]
MNARAHSLAVAVGLLVAAAFHALAWGSVAGFHSSLDFNSAPFEDFAGPYWGMGQEVFGSGRPVPGFLYSPFFAIALGAFEGVSPLVSSWVWFAVQVVATLALVALPLAWVRPTPVVLGAYVFVATTSVPILHNYHWGQVSVLLTALVLGGFVAYGRGARGLASLLIALAASIKFYPAFFLVYFVVREDWRTACAGALWTVFLLFGLPGLVLGPEATIAFYRNVMGTVGGAEASGGAFAAATNRQVFPAVLARLVGSGSHAAAYGALQALGFALAGVVLWLVARPGQRGADVAARGFVALSLAVPLIVSPSWPHYFAYLPACQLLSFSRSSGRVGRAAVIASIVCSSAISFRLRGDAQAFFADGWLLGASLLLLPVGLAALLDSEAPASPRSAR